MPESRAKELVEKLDQAGWKQGKGRSERATLALKNNFEIVDNELSNEILQAMGTHKELPVDAMIKKAFPPKFNKYTNGGEYKSHTDAALMGGVIRTDLACTVFLSHPLSYEGGVLEIDGLNVAYKGMPGECIVYPCHYVHRVTPVLSGERVCAITWFESLYRDVEKRDLMAKFIRTIDSIDDKYGELHTTLASIHGKLQRMWIEN